MTTLIQRKDPAKTGQNQSKMAVIVKPKTTAAQPTYRPTKAELVAIRKGEAAIAHGDYVTLTELSHDLDRRRRKAGAKAARKVSR